MISLVINTCALGAGAKTISSGGQRHSQREFVLRNFILPRAMELFAEVIVVGEWEDGRGYTYIPCESKNFDCTDALEQRQLGFEASTGQAVAFQHDDHILEKGVWCQGDVTVPERMTRLRTVEPELLNNGFGHYISGHCALYKRHVLEKCPWGAVPKVFVWDAEHTKQIEAAGFSITWSTLHKVFDVEMGATPWQ